MAEERLEEIRNARLEKRQALLEAGRNPYPSEVRRTHTVQAFTDAFDQLAQDTTPVVLVGRVVALRRHGGLVFLDVQDATGKVQLQCTQDELPEDIWKRLELLDGGDFIQAAGQAIVTKRGTQTLAVREFHIISKSLRPLPDSWYGLKDHEARFRQREVDLLLNEEVRNVVAMRSKTIQALRAYLDGREFLEVETPVLQPIPGGTMAKPFATHHQALDIPLYLRIAPELYLKRLIVGGFEKVYEIGRNFRNEGISRQHNPEFTMLEFYWAYADYEDLMDFTDALFGTIVEQLAGAPIIRWQEQELSFAAPLLREKYGDLLTKRIGIDVMSEKDPRAYEEVFQREKLTLPEVRTYSKLVDELYKELVRPEITQPTIVYDYPMEMAPLAKEAADKPGVAEMFQLVVAGTELVKAYTELNDPVEQRKRFEEQQQAREGGDEEAHAIDEDYLRAMEQGMPPAAGYGLGVDRLIMLLTDSPSLRDTISFPLMRPE